MLIELGDKVKIFNDYKFIDRTMGGSGNFEILIDTKEPDGVKTVKFVKTLERIQNFALSRD